MRAWKPSHFHSRYLASATSALDSPSTTRNPPIPTKMKLFNLILAILLANITTANLLPKSSLPFPLDPLSPAVKNPNGIQAAHLAAPAPPVSNPDVWRTSVARGRKLLQGMHSADSVAATLFNLGSTAESPFDGPGATTFATWGYNENAKQHARVDKECDFAAYHKLARTFADLGMGTQSKGAGGPNECFVVNHRDGPAVKRNWRGKVPEVERQRYEVCGVEYRVCRLPSFCFLFLPHPQGTPVPRPTLPNQLTN
jgi:hypothetical protein